MKIKMLNKHGRNAVQNELVSALLAARKPIQIDHLFLRFDVDEWRTFLTMLWLAYAAASRLSDGEAMRSRYRVSLTKKNGKEYYTDVWYDEEERCIHYASLY